MSINSLLIILMKWQVPRLKLNLQSAKAAVEQNRHRMPGDVQEFFEVRLRRIFTAAGADLQFDEEDSTAGGEKEPDIPHELYPTESRIKQKEKEKVHKERTGEKYIPTKRPAVIEPGNDDCGEGRLLSTNLFE